MGKLGRLCVSVVPYALSVLALACLVIVCVGCTGQNADIDNLYFFRLDFSNLTAVSGSTTSEKHHSSNSSSLGYLSTALHGATSDGQLKDFYSVGLWSYCEGEITEQGNYDTTYCSSPHPNFWFNPIKVWRLNETSTTGSKDAELPSHLAKSLRVYKKVSLWMSTGYIIAITVTAVELLLGILSICSRWGSCVTSLVSAVACLFTLAGAITATVIFSVLKGTFATTLKDLHITTTLGTRVLVASWTAVVFSLAGMLFWIITSCCCSGRPRNSSARDDGRNYPYVGVPPTDSTAQGPSLFATSMTGQYPLQPMQHPPQGPPSNGYLYP
ncbi:SUR7/PalI family-domain-containing protein [Aspergillus carlsbadensis]|nr:SUR7/PalI family-domain-containing protein [Aspergillus carlsbadensis]